MAAVDMKRVALVVVVLLSDLLFTGLIFGWAPLLLMLQDEQQYGELCEATGKAAPCVDQENKLNLMFAAASVAANIGALPIGMFLDYCGPKVAITLAALLEISGLVLMALADSQQFDVFVPAYVLLAFGGSVTMMCSFPASFLIMKYQTAILAAISCLFDGSSAVFLVLYSIRSNYGVERRDLFLMLAVGATCVYLVLIALWHVNEKALLEDDEDLVQPEEERHLLPVFDRIESDEYNATSDVRRVQRRKTQGLLLVDQPFRKQVFTSEYGFILTFAVVQVLRANVFIGTTNKLLENYGDQAFGFLYTKIFSFVLPLGFLFVPGIDYVVEKKGLSVSLVVTNSLGVVYNAMLLVPSLTLQCLTFFVFTGFRAFLYAVMSAFTAKTFGLKNLGTLSGLMFTMCSLVSLLEYPAVTLSNTYFDGKLTVVNSICMLLCVLLFPYTEFYRAFERRRLGKLRFLDASSRIEPEFSPVGHGMAYLRSPYHGRSPARLARSPARINAAN
jgi:MFS transporter, LAT3 family, solute carrier family 43, member 3